MAFLAVYFQLILSAARRVLVVPCVQLHWAASLHPIWSSYAKETRRKQHLPVLSTRGVPPSTQSKFSLWGWGVIRVSGLQSSPFQGRCLSAALKRGSFGEKAFHCGSKKRSARVTCNCSGHEHQTGAAGRVLRLQGSPFQGRCHPLRSPKQMVLVEKGFSF